MDVLSFLQSSGYRGCEAVGDLGAGEFGGACAVAGDDELEDLVVLVEVDRSGLIPGGEFEADVAVAVRLVPQVIQELHHDVVVRAG